MPTLKDDLSQYSLRLSEAARLADVHEDTLRRGIARGELPAIRVRGRFRISPEDLRTFLTEPEPPEHRP